MGMHLRIYSYTLKVYSGCAWLPVCVYRPLKNVDAVVRYETPEVAEVSDSPWVYGVPCWS